MLNPQIDSLCVLILEDDDDDFLIFSLASEEVPMSLSLIRCSSGDELLEAIEKNKPDVLFLDLRLPRIDGFTCLRKIRADKKYGSLPVVIHSSMSDPNSIDSCYREGANLFTSKPGTIKELKAMLERILIIDWKTLIPSRSNFVLPAPLIAD